jgi:addiction module RelE/StbE family toxin
MWLIFEEKTAEKQLDKAPKEIIKAYEFWKNVVVVSGPEELKKFSGFRDHALKGQWAGSRSSYLNIKWRVIYIVDGEHCKIFVLEVNSHDYRNKS